GGRSSFEPLRPVAERILRAREGEREVILMMGAHVLRSGVQRYLIDLMERGLITAVAVNGSVIVHDFELALVGATTESVARYVKEGRFGLWKETSRLNDIISAAWSENREAGLGESVGRHIEGSGYPHREISLLAAACRCGVPVTVHVGMGYDIIHEHPNCDGAATGALSYNDFLTFASIVGNLEGGVVMNFGSAVMAPEIFLKALSMARNRAHQEGQEIRHFTTLVADLHELPSDYREEPSRETPGYYFRPWKTMLVRTVRDGGESYYVRGRHRETLPALWREIGEGRKG
ncbi:MAG: GSU2086 family protein, partial [Planctomycetota bacterium]